LALSHVGAALILMMTLCPPIPPIFSQKENNKRTIILLVNAPLAFTRKISLEYHLELVLFSLAEKNK